jgi:hypothetical protein
LPLAHRRAPLSAKNASAVVIAANFSTAAFRETGSRGGKVETLVFIRVSSPMPWPGSTLRYQIETGRQERAFLPWRQRDIDVPKMFLLQFSAKAKMPVLIEGTHLS